ncbi:MAG: DUF3365 domain-containing protein, partial [Cellvibrionaceae bacterium]|nr:DUF3365 domain-containing protein [Cellvibrionaceae bacterium]
MRLPILACLTLALTGNALANGENKAQPELPPEVAANKALVKELAGQLKARLMGAVKSGGPVAGIEQCQVAAPEIRQNMQAKHGQLISIGRRSLKPRNPGNQPDEWQREQLEKFDAAKARGEKPGYATRTLEVDGKQAMEFMSPIPTAGLCLNCHGENLKPPIAAKLKE